MPAAYGSNDKGRPLRDGEVVSIYGALGEGCSRAWIGGSFPVICGLIDVDGNVSPSAWLVEIQLPEGGIAWTLAGEQWISQAGLNHRMAQTISNSEMSLEQKLGLIRSDMRLGGEINGSLTVYGGDTPLEAAVLSSSVPLLRALRVLGMDFSRGCVAHMAAWNALESSREAALQFLIDNGLDLSCLDRPENGTSPAIHEFIARGLGADHYPVAEAVRLARFLTRNGVDVTAPDHAGRTVVDLAEERNRAANGRLSPLIEALHELSFIARSTLASPSRTDPSASVLSAFYAFARGAPSIATFMSEEGARNAALFCRDDEAVGCLISNYRDLDRFESADAVAIEVDSVSARVRLHSEWQAPGALVKLCQVYRLTRTPLGWQIDFFGGADPCR